MLKADQKLWVHESGLLTGGFHCDVIKWNVKVLLDKAKCPQVFFSRNFSKEEFSSLLTKGCSKPSCQHSGAEEGGKPGVSPRDMQPFTQSRLGLYLSWSLSVRSLQHNFSMNQTFHFLLGLGACNHRTSESGVAVQGVQLLLIQTLD